MRPSQYLAIEESIRSRWRTVLAGVVVAAGLLCYACTFVVQATDYALVTEFGAPIRTVLTPGLGFKYPYQSVRKFDNRLAVFVPPASEFLTLEKRPVVAASALVWQIADPKRFFETVFDEAGAESRLGDILYAELGAAIGQSPIESFVSSEPGVYRASAILAEVTRRCREIALRDYGVELSDIKLQSFDFPKQNRPRLFARMASERSRLSMKYRSEGDEEGLKVRTAAQGEKSRILSDALVIAQKHRAEGEAHSARISADAFNASPEFYRFLRTLDASRHLIGKDTAMVLPEDSEMFGLLVDSRFFELDRESDSVVRPQ